MTLQIQLVDDFYLVYEGTPLTTFHTPRLQSLLAYLVLHRHAPQSRARIAFQIWPDTPESQARANLRVLIHRLRHKLPEAEQFLTVTNQTLQWWPTPPSTWMWPTLKRPWSKPRRAPLWKSRGPVYRRPAR